MRGCFKFDENPAVVSLRADLASYWIFSLVHAKVSRMYGSEYGAFYARRRPVWQSHESRQYNQMVKTVFLSIILVLQTYILWSRTVQLEKQVTRRVTWLSVVSKGGNAPPRLALRQFSFEHFQTQNYAAALRSKIHSRGWRNHSKGSLKLFVFGAAQKSWVIFEIGRLGVCQGGGTVLVPLSFYSRWCSNLFCKQHHQMVTTVLSTCVFLLCMCVGKGERGGGGGGGRYCYFSLYKVARTFLVAGCIRHRVVYFYLEYPTFTIPKSRSRTPTVT